MRIFIPLLFSGRRFYLVKLLSLINKDSTWVNTVLVFEKIKVIGVKEEIFVYNTF